MGVSEWRKFWANGLPSDDRSPKTGHRMTAKRMPFLWRGNGGTISTNFDVIWGMSDESPASPSNVGLLAHSFDVSENIFVDAIQNCFKISLVEEGLTMLTSKSILNNATFLILARISFQTWSVTPKGITNKGEKPKVV
jgi:hypothetical protein